MENILLVINIILALILVSLILLQKTEGWSRRVFYGAIDSRAELTPTSSVLDTVEEKTEDTPSIPENN